MERVTIEGFLAGRRECVEPVRSAVAGVVRRFRLDGGPPARTEAVQEVLGRLFLSLTAGRFREEASLITYAEKVARFTCLELLRKRRFLTRLDAGSSEPPARGPTPEQSVLRSEDHRLRVKALAAIPQECRELFHLIFIERLTYRQVGEWLGLSEAGIKSRVHRCRAAARQALLGASAKPSPEGTHYRRRGKGR